MRPPAPFSRADFARVLAEKFAAARLLVLGGAREALAVSGARVEAIYETIEELDDSLGQNGAAARFDLALWFYTPEADDGADDRAITRLSELTDSLVLLPAAGADPAKRRARLVDKLSARGFAPDYAYDVSDLDASAVRLIRAGAVDVADVEAGFARLHAQQRGLQRTLQTRLSELEAADQHIASLEQKLLKLKEARRELKQLKADKLALRKSPERKVGQVILAPYLLPQKLFREIGKRRARQQRAPSAASEYQAWFERHRVTAARAAEMREEGRAFAYRPCVSIITPVFNTPVAWLEEAVQSVLAQAYENWELILIDDASTDPQTLAMLEAQPARDSRIVTTKAPQRGGISAASNRGLELACGDWVAFLDHDDVLEPDALFQHVSWLQNHPDADLIYSDEDKLTDDGLDSPIFKPDWSPDFFAACNYVCHFTMLRRDILREIGGFRSEFDGAQDYDLFFRVAERTSRIDHVPRVLYHWRRSAASTADNIRRKPQSLETGRLAVQAHLDRCGIAGHVAVDWRTHAYWIKRDLPEARKISIIIPVRDRIDLLARCLSSLTTRTHYENYEIVVVDNDSQSEEAHAFFCEMKHRLLRFPGPFNFSAINNFAAQQTESPWLLFLNNDTEIIDGSWLTTMAEHIQRPEVGAVGPRLLYPDDTIQHGGIVMGVGGIAEHAFRGFPAESPGVCRQLQVTRNYSAVTGACLLTRRAVFEGVGGFDEERLPVTFNDVDLCLKIRRAGYLIVYTPFAKLYHHESATRRRPVEAMETGVIRERWPEVLAHDPYYNPNLSRERADFSLGK